MLLITLLCILTFIIYTYLGCFAIIQNRKNPSNRIFFFITVIFSFWALAAALRNNFDSDIFIHIWNYSALFAWTFGSASILDFTLSLTQQKSINKKYRTHLIYYLPIGILVVGYLLIQSINPSVLIFQIFNRIICPIFYLLSLTSSIYCLIKWNINCTSKREKMQSKLVLFSLILTTLSIFIYDVILPMFYGQTMFFLMPVFPIFWIMGMWHAITEYGLLEFNPKVAVNEVMDSILEGIIMVNHSGKIVEVNSSIQTLFLLQNETIKQLTVFELFDKNEDLVHKIKECLSGRISYINEEIEIKTTEDSTFLRLKISPVKSKIDETIGLVISAHDLTLERKNTVFAMAVTANHEINQPLMVANGNLQILENKLEGLEEKTNLDLGSTYIKKALLSLDKIEHILTKYRETEKFTLDNYTEGVKMINFSNKNE